MFEEDLLTGDHTELNALLNEVFKALEMADDRAAFEKLDHFWARLAIHIRAEHLHLFPSILEYCEHTPAAMSISSDIREKLKRLKHDHDFFMRELTQAVRSMREVSVENAARTRIQISALLRDIGKRLNEHNRIEETEVYPLMKELLANKEFEGLAALMKKELDNLPPRFRRNSSN